MGLIRLKRLASDTNAEMKAESAAQDHREGLSDFLGRKSCIGFENSANKLQKKSRIE